MRGLLCVALGLCGLCGRSLIAALNYDGLVYWGLVGVASALGMIGFFWVFPLRLEERETGEQHNESEFHRR